MRSTIIFKATLYLLITLLTSNLLAQTEKFTYHQYIGRNGDTLNYRMLFPDYDTLQNYPLIIFLHGSGERGNDNRAQLRWGVLNFATDRASALHPAFIIAPQCPEHQTWENVNKDANGLHLLPEPSQPMKLVIAMVHDFIKKHHIDTTRIYLTGLSMGAYGTYDWLQRQPELFAAVVPVCGAGDVSRAKDIASIPMWIFHGNEDSAVDFQNSISMYNALVKAGGHPGLTIYPQTGHFSWLKAYTDPYLIEWLFSQHN